MLPNSIVFFHGFESGAHGKKFHYLKKLGVPVLSVEMPCGRGWRGISNDPLLWVGVSAVVAFLVAAAWKLYGIWAVCFVLGVLYGVRGHFLAFALRRMLERSVLVQERMLKSQMKELSVGKTVFGKRE